MIEFYKKYVHYIVGVLLGMYCMKSCHSCSVESGRKWDAMQYEQRMDSMKQIQFELNDSLIEQKDSIVYYKYQMNRAAAEVERLKDMNMYLRRTNNRLIEKY